MLLKYTVSFFAGGPRPIREKLTRRPGGGPIAGCVSSGRLFPLVYEKWAGKGAGICVYSWPNGGAITTVSWKGI